MRSRPTHRGPRSTRRTLRRSRPRRAPMTVSAAPPPRTPAPRWRRARPPKITHVRSRNRRSAAAGRTGTAASCCPWSAATIRRSTANRVAHLVDRDRPARVSEKLHHRRRSADDERDQHDAEIRRELRRPDRRQHAADESDTSPSTSRRDDRWNRITAPISGSRPLNAVPIASPTVGRLPVAHQRQQRQIADQLRRQRQRDAGTSRAQPQRVERSLSSGRCIICVGSIAWPATFSLGEHDRQRQAGQQEEHAGDDQQHLAVGRASAPWRRSRRRSCRISCLFPPPGIEPALDKRGFEPPANRRDG